MKMILKLYEELDKEKSENSIMDFSLTRSLKVREFVEKIGQHHSFLRKMMKSSHFHVNFAMNLFFKVMN